MLLDVLIGYGNHTPKGYVAGMGDGIVTVGGVPSERDIYVLTADGFAQIGVWASLKNGHYLITGLDPNKRYLVLCRDYKQEYEPAVWDFVAPNTDLNIEEQQALWESWQ